MEEAVNERRKAFAAAHKSDEDRQAYISAFRRASPVIANTKAKAWQATCSSLLPKSNPKSVYSLLRSVSGSSLSSSSSPNFLNCSSSRESASVFADYLRSHFSVSQPKALRTRSRGYLSELYRATQPKGTYSSFYSPFFRAEFLVAASNLSSSTGAGPEKVAYPMLKHLPCSGVSFLLHVFNLSSTLHSFPSIWKTSSIIPIHKMEKSFDSPASFRPISLAYCVSKFFKLIILSRLLKSFDSGIPPFSINSFQLAFLLAFLVGLNLSFLIGALAWFIKITKVVLFESVEVFRKNPFLALCVSLFS